MNKFLLTASTLSLITACGSLKGTASTATSSEAIGAEANSDKVPKLIDTISLTPVNGGINPNYIGLKIKAHVQIGGNPCMAKGIKANLITARENDHLVVKALSNKITSRVCTMEYDPVYTDIEATIKYDSTEIKDFLIENYKEMGAIVSLKDLR